MANDAGFLTLDTEWFTMKGIPAEDLGKDGDMFLDTDAGNIYGPKLKGTWGSPVSNIRGTILISGYGKE
jgi:hypothetical protein